jgi:alpha-D-ribose 1-methylphosphonate 5-triphosphate diphosphatase
MWISGARLVLPERVLEIASLRIQGGLIAEIREGLVPGGCDARGLTLIPGIVDLHGDALEKELEPRPGVFLPTEMALEAWEARMLAAGITTAFVALSFWEGLPGLRAPGNALALAEEIAALRGQTLVDVRLHARYEVSAPGGAKAVLEALRRGWVDLLSLMDHTPGQGQFKDPEAYVRYLSKLYGLSQEATAASLVAKKQEHQQVAEAVASEAKALGVPLASHDDDTPAKVRLMAQMGVRISEFPTALEAALEAKAQGMLVAMGAPNALRGSSHVGNLSAREAGRRAALDLLVTDYLPSSMLRAAFSLAEEGWPLPKAVALITTNPARAAGLRDRGALVPGLRADLVLLQERPLRVHAVFVKGKSVLIREGVGIGSGLMGCGQSPVG